MRELLLSFNRAITPKDLAPIVNLSPETIRRKAKQGLIRRVSGTGKVEFDPMVVADYFFPVQSSLKIKKRVSRRDSVQTEGVYTCL